MHLPIVDVFVPCGHIIYIYMYVFVLFTPYMRCGHAWCIGLLRGLTFSLGCRLCGSCSLRRSLCLIDGCLCEHHTDHVCAKASIGRTTKVVAAGEVGLEACFLHLPVPGIDVDGAIMVQPTRPASILELWVDAGDHEGGALYELGPAPVDTVVVLFAVEMVHGVVLGEALSLSSSLQLSIGFVATGSAGEQVSRPDLHLSVRARQYPCSIVGEHGGRMIINQPCR